MAILIKNAEVEKRARELAALTGQTLTSAIGEAVKLRLEQERAKPKRRPTVEEILAATDDFRRKVGLDKHKLDVTKADFDELWDMEQFDEIEGR
jgi:antitoxin VapB